MVMTDPVADMFTRIRNASNAYKEEVSLPTSRLKADIARILKEEGFVEDFRVSKQGSFEMLTVRLKYGPNKQRSVSGIKRISKPGLRVYARKDEIPRVLGGLGEAILSTSRGVLTGRQATREGVGGEVLCFIW